MSEFSNLIGTKTFTVSLPKSFDEKFEKVKNFFLSKSEFIRFAILYDYVQRRKSEIPVDHKAFRQFKILEQNRDGLVEIVKNLEKERDDLQRANHKCDCELAEFDNEHEILKCAKCGYIITDIYVGIDENGVYITQRKGSDETLSQQSEPKPWGLPCPYFNEDTKYCSLLEKTMDDDEIEWLCGISDHDRCIHFNIKTQAENR